MDNTKNPNQTSTNNAAPQPQTAQTAQSTNNAGGVSFVQPSIQNSGVKTSGHFVLVLFLIIFNAVFFALKIISTLIFASAHNRYCEAVRNYICPPNPYHIIDGLMLLQIISFIPILFLCIFLLRSKNREGKLYKIFGLIGKIILIILCLIFLSFLYSIFGWAGYKGI